MPPELTETHEEPLLIKSRQEAIVAYRSTCILKAMTSPKLKLPEIPEAELTPLMQQLLEIILRQQEQIEEQQEEIRRLKGHKGKPLIKPSRMDKETQGGEQTGKERKRGPQRSKTAQLQAVDEVIAPEGLPANAREQGWRFKG
jgi:hypothetical protein